jgi:hypothetical protein
VAHAGPLTDLALQVVEESFARHRVAAKHERRQHVDFAACARARHPIGHVFAAQAVIGFDRDRVLDDLDRGASLEADHLADAGAFDIARLEFEIDDLDRTYRAHVWNSRLNGLMVVATR